MEKTHTSIERSVSKRKQGGLIFPSDFHGNGTDAAIKKALSRLSAKGLIKRLAHGVYYIPKQDPILGEIRPGADEVVKMLAEKEKIRIKPAGAYALHQLGLTTQVPTRRVYITDGHPRQFMLGKLQIKFKATTSKRLLRKGKISSLVIQALEELGADNIDSVTAGKIKELLLKEDPKTLKHDLELAPAKVNNFIIKLLKRDLK
jgi:hypothetical protein